MKIFYHKKEKNLFLSLKRKKGFKVFKLTKKTKSSTASCGLKKEEKLSWFQKLLLFP